jgi:hypothetical protein
VLTNHPNGLCDKKIGGQRCDVLTELAMNCHDASSKIVVVHHVVANQTRSLDELCGHCDRQCILRSSSNSLTAQNDEQ